MGKTGGLFPPDQRDVRRQRGEGQIEDFNRELATGIAVLNSPHVEHAVSSSVMITRTSTPTGRELDCVRAGCRSSHASLG